jgi:quercetin dioxygenase-like cupin family protein
MTKIRFLERDAVAAVVAHEMVPPEERHRYTDDEMGAVRRTYFPVDDEPLELFEMTVLPDSETRSHAHDVPEIIYVLRGELRFGARVCRPGSAVFVAADTLYGFRAGPEGASFLNFRGTPSAGFTLKEDFLATAGKRSGAGS